MSSRLVGTSYLYLFSQTSLLLRNLLRGLYSTSQQLRNFWVILHCHLLFLFIYPASRYSVVFHRPNSAGHVPRTKIKIHFRLFAVTVPLRMSHESISLLIDARQPPLTQVAVGHIEIFIKLLVCISWSAHLFVWGSARLSQRSTSWACSFFRVFRQIKESIWYLPFPFRVCVFICFKLKFLTIFMSEALSAVFFRRNCRWRPLVASAVSFAVFNKLFQTIYNSVVWLKIFHSLQNYFLFIFHCDNIVFICWHFRLH